MREMSQTAHVIVSMWLHAAANVAFLCPASESVPSSKGRSLEFWDGHEFSFGEGVKIENMFDLKS